MPQINLRRFSNVDLLAKLNDRELRTLLSRYAGYFEKRQIRLDGPLDLERLAAVFLAPDEGLPESLVNALYLIHEVSSPLESEELVDAVRRDPALKKAIDLTTELTPLDLALKVFLVAPDLLEREHAERYVETRKAFEYYLPEFAVPMTLTELDRAVVGLERDLGAWFASKLKGEHVRVFAYPREDEVYFVVRHGEAFRRELALRGAEPTTVFYRPARHDVLVYQRRRGELGVNAATKGERELYRRTVGLHLFGSQDHFRRGQAKYTLKPLLDVESADLVCGDVDGLESVQLVDFSCVRPADDLANEPFFELRVSVDGAKPLKALIPEGSQIVSARFRIKFSRSLRPRHVTLRLPNIAMFTRDDDGQLVNEWLAKRGFVVRA